MPAKKPAVKKGDKPKSAKSAKSKKARPAAKPKRAKSVTPRKTAPAIKHREGGANVFTLKVTLLDVAPPVWRRVEVKDCDLDVLGNVLMNAMGWDGTHLFEFQINGESYLRAGIPNSDTPSASDITLGELTADSIPEILFVYDLGDCWEHLVEIEKVFAAEPGVTYPRVLDGARNCPPDDCGGFMGYEEFLAAIRDKRHPQHRDMVEWIGGRFDPEAFSVAEANKRLK